MYVIVMNHLLPVNHFLSIDQQTEFPKLTVVNLECLKFGLFFKKTLVKLNLKWNYKKL